MTSPLAARFENVETSCGRLALVAVQILEVGALPRIDRLLAAGLVDLDDIGGPTPELPRS
jgi:hypothetical protein